MREEDGVESKGERETERENQVWRQIQPDKMKREMNKGEGNTM